MHPQSVTLAVARQLKFSPDWPCSDGRVVFDCLSGDYWVVSALSAWILDQLKSGQGMPVSQLQQVVPEALQSDAFQATFEQTLQSLHNAGLLQFAGASPGSTSPLTDSLFG